jgi:hypothetical protein
MQTAKLQSITATHLALSSQCLGLLVSQTPALKRAFAATLPAKKQVLLSALDSTARDFRDHRREIAAKLIAIVRQLVEGACKRLVTAAWARPPTVLSEEVGAAAAAGVTAVAHASSSLSSSSSSVAAATAPVSREVYEKAKEEPVTVDACVRTLMKQTSSLHRALSDLFTRRDRDDVFARIAQLFSSIFGKYLSRLDATHPYVQRKLTVNVKHVLQWLRSLEGTGDADPTDGGETTNACPELTVFIN